MGVNPVNHLPVQLYTSASRSVEPLIPHDGERIKLYSCGPTVYRVQHIGNMRYVFMVDFLRRVIEHLGGMPVDHVMNITDVGHLVDEDNDQGEDKMEKRSAEEGISVFAIAEKYTALFMDDITRMGADGIGTFTKATDYIPEQITMVQSLVEQGKTYVIAGDGIYCDTGTIDDYGSLLPEGHLEGMQTGARVDATGKRNPTDFALWKFSPSDSQRQMEWIFDGERSGVRITDEVRATLTEAEQATLGFPGRHIECSAMAYATLGATLDIHTGGVEHITVHHTNEIVQSEHTFCSTPRCKHRFHLQHLMLDGKKISKSVGNVVYCSDCRDRGFAGEDLRWYFMSAHYRSFQDFTWNGMTQAKTTRARCVEALTAGIQKANGRDGFDLLSEMVAHRQPSAVEPFTTLVNDLDSVTTLKEITARCKQPHTYDEYVQFLATDHHVTKLGLLAGIEAHLALSTDIPERVLELAQRRLEAKAEKNYQRADSLRDQIDNEGYSVKDTPDGFALTRTVETAPKGE